MFRLVYTQTNPDPGGWPHRTVQVPSVVVSYTDVSTLRSAVEKLRVPLALPSVGQGFDEVRHLLRVRSGSASVTIAWGTGLPEELAHLLPAIEAMTDCAAAAGLTRPRNPVW